MLAKPEIVECVTIRSLAHEETAAPTRIAMNQVCARGSEEVQGESEPIPRPHETTLSPRDGATTQWVHVPKLFLFLVVFCVGFALLSLLVLLVMATSTTENTVNARASTRDNGVTKSSSFLLVIGVFSSIVGSLQTASGYCAQRLSHQLSGLRRRRHQQCKSTASTPKHPLFYVGLLLLVCGTISAVVNLGILGQSVTAPFAAMTLVFNGGLAFSVLHEAVTKYDVIATVFVLLGVGVAMLGVGMAQLDVQAFMLTDIETIFVRSPFPALYSICLLGSLAISLLVIKKRRLQSKPAGMCCFSIGAGVLSGFSSLCVKCTVEVMKGVSQHPSNDLSNPVLYVFVVGIPVCVLSQLKLMTLGLQHFGTLKFVPPYHAFIILSNMINGMVYFDEARGYDTVSATLFIAGCAMTIGGVFVLLAKAPESIVEEGDDEKMPAKSMISKSGETDMDTKVSTSSTSTSESDPELTPVVRLEPVTTLSMKREDGHDRREDLIV